MPRDRKSRLMRTAGQCYHNMLRAYNDLLDLYHEFQPVKPEYAELLGVIAAGLDQTMGVMEDFARLAWNATPETLENRRK